jgi:lysozyme
VESAFSGLMNSPTHKENILETKYTHVGIGVVEGGLYGKMFSQEFVAYPKSTYSASSDPSLDLLVYVNDNLLYSDPPAFITNGHTLVPAEQLLNELGIDAISKDGGKQIVINRPDATIVLTVDNPIAMVNDQPIALETAPIIKKNTTFIPLRFIAESFGASVSWNNKLRVISVLPNPKIN